MLSKRLEQFVKDNEPKEITISRAVAAEIARQLGMEAYFFGDKLPKEIEMYTISENQSFFATFTKGRFGKKLGAFTQIDLKIEWRSEVRPTEVDYEPFVHTSYYSSYAGKQILQWGAVEKKTVAFPEATVELPIPSWVSADCSDWTQGVWNTSTTCFQSEVKEIVQPFIAELQKFL